MRSLTTSFLLVALLALAGACGEDEPEFCRFSFEHTDSSGTSSHAGCLEMGGSPSSVCDNLTGTLSANDCADTHQTCSGSDVWVDSPTDQVCGSATNAVIGASLGSQ